MPFQGNVLEISRIAMLKNLKISYLCRFKLKCMGLKLQILVFILFAIHFFFLGNAIAQSPNIDSLSKPFIDFEDTIGLLAFKNQKQVLLLSNEVNKNDTDKAILESANQFQKIILYGTSAGLVLVLILLGYIYRSRQKYMRISALLEFRNGEISRQALELQKNYKKLNDFSAEIFQQKEEILVQRESLEQAITRLKELQKYKDGVAAMIVHDLKNPLNTILNQAKNVLISESASQMLNMVNNILDLQKYEGTTIPLTLKTGKLNTIIENALFNTRYLTESKNLTIRNLISRNVEVYVDINLIERVFINLVTNAIKYSPFNESILIESENSDVRYVKISVSDHGPGIPAGIKDKVFEKFPQLPGQDAGYSKSTGLGLAFCKMVIEAHGCSIDTTPAKGGGATFFFTLPVSGIFDEVKTTHNRTTAPFGALKKHELELLEPQVDKIRKIPIYETGNIHFAIKTIQDMNIPVLEKWLQALQNASYAVNQAQFEDLLDMTSHFTVE
jgi:signal transduction histidine kinase